MPRETGRGDMAQHGHEVVTEPLPFLVRRVFALHRPITPEGEAAAPGTLCQPGGKRAVLRRAAEIGRLLQGDARGEVALAVGAVVAAVQLVVSACPNSAARHVVAAGEVVAQGVAVVAAQVDVLQRIVITRRLLLQDGKQFVVGKRTPGGLQAGE